MTAVTFACPHVDAGQAGCPGCRQPHKAVEPDTWACVTGEYEAIVILDSDGDAGVIGGVRHFWTVDDWSLSCNCKLTDEQLEKLADEAADQVTFNPVDD